MRGVLLRAGRDEARQRAGICSGEMGGPGREKQALSPFRGGGWMAMKMGYCCCVFGFDDELDSRIRQLPCPAEE